MTTAQLLRDAQRDRSLIAAAAALADGKLDVAERELKAKLLADPINIAAIRMLAELAGRLGRYRDAEKLLARALELAPDFHAARANYVMVLQRQSKFTEALAQAEQLITDQPQDLGHLASKAAVLVRTGEYDAAITAYEKILAVHPDQSRLWISYGHVLKTIGRQRESIAAYRTAIEQSPTLGDGWWSLANLKTVSLDSTDVAAMEQALKDTETTADRYHLHFALGKALEDRASYSASFKHYAAGNRLRHQELQYQPDKTSAHLAQCRELLTAHAFSSRNSGGHPSDEPIFIVGLPRAGSTLIEQILASHTEVEGTMELPDIGTIAANLGERRLGDRGGQSSYVSRLLQLNAEERYMLGQSYLDTTRVQRKTKKRRFIDKMPNNFGHIGLIHLILPNAVIIDARRHPVANCFSAFKQHFSRGQGFTYDLDDLGRYWNDYAALMAHFDDALPGRIYRVEHEELLRSPQEQIADLLSACGLSFQEACLSPHQTDRPVRTASSEQVRRPIAATPDESWRNYQTWLGPLRDSLGETTVEYEVAQQRRR